MRVAHSSIASIGPGLLLGVLAACAGAAPDPPERPVSLTTSGTADRPPQEWSDYLGELPEAGLVARFLAATEAMLDTPYHDGPLGEGDGIDPDPRADFDRVDCVTYLEQALALAMTSDESGPFLENLDGIRYTRGRATYEDRNHYMVTDWIPSNAALLDDVTATLAPDRTRTVTRTIDRAAFLRDHGVVPRSGADESREHELEYLPTDALAEAESEIRDGDLVFWVGKAEGIFVVHTGLAVRDRERTLLFRHGSSRAGRVVQEPLADYAAAATFAIGFLVLRIRESGTLRSAAAAGERSR